jgi:hypothetical protein
VQISGRLKNYYLSNHDRPFPKKWWSGTTGRPLISPLAMTPHSLVRALKHGIQEGGDKVEGGGFAGRASLWQLGQTEAHPRVHLCMAECATQLQLVVRTGTQEGTVQRPAHFAGLALCIFFLHYQGSTLRTVRLPGTIKSGSRASRYPCQLARQTTKYFTFLLTFNTLDK